MYNGFSFLFINQYIVFDQFLNSKQVEEIQRLEFQKKQVQLQIDRLTAEEMELENQIAKIQAQAFANSLQRLFI